MKWWQYNSFAARVVPLTWSWTCWCWSDALVRHLWCQHPLPLWWSNLLEADALALQWVEVSWVFLQPLGGPAAAGSCWLLWLDKADPGLHILLKSFRTLTLVFSLGVLRIYMMCKKPLEVVCYPLLFILSITKSKLLCPLEIMSGLFVRTVYAKKINLETLDLFQIIIWSFCHHNHFKKGKHKPKTKKVTEIMHRERFLGLLHWEKFCFLSQPFICLEKVQLRWLNCKCHKIEKAGDI